MDPDPYLKGMYPGPRYIKTRLKKEKGRHKLDLHPDCSVFFKLEKSSNFEYIINQIFISGILMICFLPMRTLFTYKSYNKDSTKSRKRTKLATW